MAWGTEIPTGGSGPPSRLNKLAILGNLSLCAFTQACAPNKPNSSPANPINKIVRLGLAPDLAIMRAASIIGPIPVPQSMPPVATSKASRWPLIITYSSGYLLPLIDATTLWYLTGPNLKWLRISNSSSNVRLSFTICSMIANWCSSNLISGSSGRLSKFVFGSFIIFRSYNARIGTVEDWIKPKAPASHISL